MPDRTNSKNIKKQPMPDKWRLLSAGAILALNPEELLGNYDHIFKQDRNSFVALKSLATGAKNVKVVIKIQHRGKKFKDFLRSILPSRAVRNFRKALLLASKNIPVARPVAAMEQRRYFSVAKDICVFEYIENSMSLYDILFDKDAYAVSHWAKAKKEIVNEIAIILADLHNAGFWHRDSKAGNFLICRQPDNSYKVKLIDLDGIKRYRFGAGQCMMRTLCNLGETVIRFRRASITDLWRGFCLYCDKVGIDKNNRSAVFRRLRQMIIAKRLLIEIKDAYKKNRYGK
ncbi:MAG: lipopolysaccharide kinase InaA family protein [Anaerohalosphaeraceae bacterium]|nr:lipopolysaccharide kinase InaA family protein [Anaerohalosphaeraceae bacterium]